MDNLEQRVHNIEDRNKRVEIDKAWEISWTRRLLLTCFIYLAVGFYSVVVDVKQPWLSAIIPAFAFLVSTLTMPFFKKLWFKLRHSIK